MSSVPPIYLITDRLGRTFIGEAAFDEQPVHKVAYMNFALLFGEQLQQGNALALMLRPITLAAPGEMNVDVEWVSIQRISEKAKLYREYERKLAEIRAAESGISLATTMPKVNSPLIKG